MSRLLTTTIDGDLRDATAEINKLGLARFVLQMHFNSSGSWVHDKTIVILRVDDYPTYTWLCEKLGRKPISTQEYFK